MKKKIRYGIPQTTDGRVIRWFVDTFEEMKEYEEKD